MSFPSGITSQSSSAQKKAAGFQEQQRFPCRDPDEELHEFVQGLTLEETATLLNLDSKDQARLGYWKGEEQNEAVTRDQMKRNGA